MANILASKAKAAVGSLVAASILVGAVPANAQYRGHHRDRDGISAGEVIAGAVVIGGLVAILSAGSRDRGYDRDRTDGRSYDPQYDSEYDRNYGGYDRGGYGGQWRRTGSREAVERCINAAEQRASYYGNRADVTRITEVDRVRGGYEVRGRIAVDDQRGRYDRYDRRGGYDRGDRYDRAGYDDRGHFRCTVRYGQVQNVRVGGLG
jgi:hypothetical protein